MAFVLTHDSHKLVFDGKQLHTFQAHPTNHMADEFVALKLCGDPGS